MGKVAILGVVLAGAVAGSSAASAPRATVPSEPSIQGYGYGPGYAQVEGHIDSPRGACLANRRLKLFAITDAGPVQIGTDKSSDNGFWGGTGPADDVNGVRVKMQPKRLGPNRSCAGGTARQMFPSFPRTPVEPNRRAVHPTEIDLGGGSWGKKGVATDGLITARRKCRVNRKIDIFALSTTGPEKVDTDHASDNGYFGGGGPATGDAAEGVRATAPVKQLPGPSSCAAASDEVGPF